MPAAARDVQHLRAAADREHRQVALERGAHQLELEVVALAHDAGRLLRARSAPYSPGSRSEPPENTSPSTASSVSSIAGARRHEQRRAARLLDRLARTTPGSAQPGSRQYDHDASVRYVVMPIRGLATFEESLPLVAGDDAIEQLLLGAPVVQVVVDDVVAERGSRKRSLPRVPRSPRAASTGTAARRRRTRSPRAPGRARAPARSRAGRRRSARRTPGTG